MCMAGGSAGSAMYCALQAAADFKLTVGQRVVVILPDSVRNYMYAICKCYIGTFHFYLKLLLMYEQF